MSNYLSVYDPLSGDLSITDLDNAGEAVYTDRFIIDLSTATTYVQSKGFFLEGWEKTNNVYVANNLVYGKIKA